MDKNQLRNFIELAHALNFSTVAKQQFISQPALTNQISRLEDELGVKLFHRTKHAVSLTYAGSEFYNYARDIIDMIDRAERRMRDISDGRTGFLKISTVTSIEAHITGYIAEFNRRYKDIQISLDSGTGTKQIMAINKKSFDVYFSFSDLLESSGTLETLPLEPDMYAIYISDRYTPEVELDNFTWLNGKNLLTESRADGPFLISQTMALLESMGVEPANIIHYPSGATILMAVRAGLGFTLLPASMNLGALPPDILVIPVHLPDAVIGNSMGWHRDTKNVAALKFIELVKEMEEK